MRPLLAAGLALALFAPAAAGAATSPTRAGEVGFFDVPTAEVLGAGGGLFGGEVRVDRMSGQPTSFGPLPLSAGAGLLPALDAAFSLREWGRPGDPKPSPLLFAGALKLKLADALGARPAFALDASVDRFNWKGATTLRAIASTPDAGRLRAAAFLGGELHGPGRSIGPVGGLGLSLRVLDLGDAILETTGGRGGAMVTTGLRWSLTPRNSLSFALSWLPSEGGLRVSLGFAAHAPAPVRKKKNLSSEPAGDEVAVVEEKPSGPTFLDDRPHFRMRIHRMLPPADLDRRHLQYALADAGAPRAGVPARAAALAASADPQLRELDALAAQLDGRERRLRATENALGSRREALVAEQAKIPPREREAVERMAALETRERGIRANGKPGDRELMLAQTEERFRDMELAARAQEKRSHDAAADTASREQAAGARERQLLAQVGQLSGQTGRGKAAGAAAAAAARARLLAVRSDQLSATEERLSAMRAHLEDLEGEIGAANGRLDALERRIGIRAERLAALDKRLATRGAAPVPAASLRTPAAPGVAVPAPGIPAPGLAAPVVPATGGAAADALVALRAPTIQRGAARGGGAERVLASALVQLAAGQPLRQSDKALVQGVAAAAVRQHGEVVVWARSSSALSAEAARRTAELQALVQAGGVPADRVTTRFTERASVTGVDVVVSARQATEAPTAAGDPSRLQDGDAGAQQVQSALAQVKASLDACLEANRPPREVELTLRLGVDATGRVGSVAGAEPAGAPFAACVKNQLTGWKFPAADASYSVSVSATVPGSAR